MIECELVTGWRGQRRLEAEAEVSKPGTGCSGFEQAECEHPARSPNEGPEKHHGQARVMTVAAAQRSSLRIVFFFFRILLTQPLQVDGLLLYLWWQLGGVGVHHVCTIST